MGWLGWVAVVSQLVGMGAWAVLAGGGFGVVAASRRVSLGGASVRTGSVVALVGVRLGFVAPPWGVSPVGAAEWAGSLPGAALVPVASIVTATSAHVDSVLPPDPFGPRHTA